MQISNIKPYQYNNPNFNGRIISKRNANKAVIYGGSASLAANTFAMLTDSYRVLPYVCTSFLIVNLLALARDFIKEKPIQLEPQIEFKPSKSIEEAAEFAKKNFKIKSFKVKDLEIANWINEGLTVLNNQFKGKVYMPLHIKECALKEDALASYRPFADTLTIAPIDEDELNFNFEVMTLFTADKNLDELSLGDGYQKFKENYDNFENLSKIDKRGVVSSLHNMFDVLNQMSDKNDLSLAADNSFGHVYYGRFAILFHEMGHVFNDKSRNDFKNSKISKIFKSERNSMVMPSYAKTNQKEFIAEIFAGILEGNKYPAKIMNLFHKLCNIELPEN